MKGAYLPKPKPSSNGGSTSDTGIRCNACGDHRTYAVGDAIRHQGWCPGRPEAVAERKEAAQAAVEAQAVAAVAAREEVAARVAATRAAAQDRPLTRAEQAALRQRARERLKRTQAKQTASIVAEVKAARAEVQVANGKHVAGSDSAASSAAATSTSSALSTARPSTSPAAGSTFSPAQGSTPSPPSSKV